MKNPAYKATNTTWIRLSPSTPATFDLSVAFVQAPIRESRPRRLRGLLYPALYSSLVTPLQAGRRPGVSSFSTARLVRPQGYYRDLRSDPEHPGAGMREGTRVPTWRLDTPRARFPGRERNRRPVTIRLAEELYQFESGSPESRGVWPWEGSEDANFAPSARFVGRTSLR
ncbi:hypothetical protein KM043_014145 [Ampulex compressa]|nr:hypothetical protein KM043_014145 [Ampulex compressa]